MTRIYRPNIKDQEFFDDVRDHVVNHPRDFEEASSWFAKDFSTTAIRRRETAERKADAKSWPDGYRQHRESAPKGRVIRRSPRTIGMRRLCSAASGTGGTDLADLGDAERWKWCHRILFILWLVTDPDAHNRRTGLIDESRPLWVEKHGERVEKFGAGWARMILFDPDFAKPTMPLYGIPRETRPKYGHWASQIREAWRLLQRGHPPVASRTTATATAPVSSDGTMMLTVRVSNGQRKILRVVAAEKDKRLLTGDIARLVIRTQKSIGKDLTTLARGGLLNGLDKQGYLATPEGRRYLREYDIAHPAPRPKSPKSPQTVL